MILSLAAEVGLYPKKVANTNGGEYHSPCPRCGGKDRFIIWNAINRYYCRQCEAKGDSIQFCRDFMGMGYRAACSKLGQEPKAPSTQLILRKHSFTPEEAHLPSEEWQSQAEKFVLACHQKLIESPEGLKLLYARGLTLPTIQRARLGWNVNAQSVSRTSWDNLKGHTKPLWLPSGIVIPTLSAEKIIKVKIRRIDWKDDDPLPKYVEIKGSMKCPSLFGEQSQNILLVEAELDALLVHQVTSDLCCCIALGGASKKPDQSTHQHLQKASLILFALDFDEAGKKPFHFWKNIYPHLKAWPVPKEKSPGDAFKAGVDLRQWILDGLDYYKINS